VLDSHDCLEPLSDIEALVRSAGSYVQASRDLRPRVLETAREERDEQRLARRIWQAAVLVVLIATFLMSPRHRPEVPDRGTSPTAAHPGEYSLFPEASEGYGDFNWGMVESFTEMRRRQAELLRLAL
jgi:hypothetical protein